MSKSTNNQPRLLHPELENHEKPLYERMPSEPARAYMRFLIYCRLGHRRTLEQAVWIERNGQPAPEAPVQVAESTEKVPEGTENIFSHFDDLADRQAAQKKAWNEEQRVVDQAVHITVGGDWKRMSSKWHWRERAAAWDEYQRQEANKKLWQYIDGEALYVSKAQRLNALDTLATSLMVGLLDKETIKHDMKSYLGCVKQLVATLKEIRREMASIESERK